MVLVENVEILAAPRREPNGAPPHRPAPTEQRRGAQAEPNDIRQRHRRSGGSVGTRQLGKKASHQCRQINSAGPRLGLQSVTNRV
jgi:hypothetical protein